MVNYANLTVIELRNILRRRGLTVSGLKADLILRLFVDDSRRKKCCINCHRPARNLQTLPTGVSCCFACIPWYRLFERSVRRINVTLRALGYDDTTNIQALASALYHNTEQNHQHRVDEMGVPYIGPIDDRHWSLLLNRMTPSHQTSNPFTIR